MNELQRVSPPSELERQGPHRPKLAPHHHARTILVIEDDTELRRLIVRSLEHAGYAVVAVGSGGEAVDWLGLSIDDGRLENVPALIVSDLRLPDFSGLELLEAISSSHVHVPTIVITAFPSSATYYEVIWFGVARILEKPFDLGELCAAVRSVLRERGTADSAPDSPR
jgi:DNA-binding response OmpR family regulator